MRNHSSQSGQILLIVVITMIVALTVGLTVASRTVTELKLSKQNEESQRAFNAAEAGIDKVLQQGEGVNLTDQLGNNSEYLVSIQDYSGLSVMLNNGELVDQDIGADVWLSQYPDYSGQIGSANLTLYWGGEDQTSCSTSDIVRPALEVVMLSGDVNNPTLTKYLYDTCSGRTAGTLTPSQYGAYTVSGLPGMTFTNRVTSTIPVSSGIIMKVIPLYNSTPVAVQSSAVLPSQGTVIESTGTSGDTVRKITYYESYPQLPLEVFPYSIISQ